MNKTIRIGSRESVLAVKQANIVMETVKEKNPGIEFELTLIKTTGDKIPDQRLDKIGGKGLFIKELEQALLEGKIDIAVHSYKDMPYTETEKLPVVALSQREAPFDALVLPPGAGGIDKTKPVGSSSLRRTIQFNKLYGGHEVKNIRGNVPTRISKMDAGEYSALILAQAGLNRLGLEKRIFRIFSIDEMIPCGSQGILAVQGRQGEDYSYLDCFHNSESEIVSKAERQYLKTLCGNCSSPVAVYAVLHNNELLLTGMYVDAHGNMETGKMSGDAGRAEHLGEALAKQLKARLENK
ncbi:MAG: hydroxymethylbilane synthase [Spirochaetes bacterium]|nr:hydroxymethylbilane synthase [Spirochaetota bacterium]